MACLTKRQRQIAAEICEIARKEGSYSAPYSVELIMLEFHCRRATAEAVWAVSPYSRVLCADDGVLYLAPHAAAPNQVGVKWDSEYARWTLAWVTGSFTGYPPEAMASA